MKRSYCFLTMCFAFALMSATNLAFGDAIDWPILSFVQVVTNVFSGPTSITHAGDGTGRIFIEEKQGRIWIIQSNTVLAGPFLEITNRALELWFYSPEILFELAAACQPVSPVSGPPSPPRPGRGTEGEVSPSHDPSIPEIPQTVAKITNADRDDARALLHSHCLPQQDVEPWPERVNGKALLDSIALVLKSFVVLPKWAAETLALWVLHTYLFKFRDVSTYIGIESPEKRCGKTTLLTVLSELVHRPVVSSNISSPAFFRVIEEVQPTLIIDEADTFLQGNHELRGILNSGYHRKTAFVVRVTHEVADARPRLGVPPSGGPADPSTLNSQPSTFHGSSLSTINSQLSTPPSASRLVRFSCWCPKAMAAIGRFPDTLADRCIVIRMQRKTPQEQCERLRNLETTDLREKCARFSLDNAAAVASARPELPSSLNDRATDIWEPLLALADLAGGDWPALARQAAVALTATAQDSNTIASLLLDVYVAFAISESDRMFSRELVERLIMRSAGRPWLEARKGKEVNELWLAQQLRPYGIKPRTIWIGDSQAKGYYFEDFRDASQRYVPKAEAQAFLDELRNPNTKGDAASEPAPRSQPQPGDEASQ